RPPLGAYLADRLQEGQRFDVADRAADFHQGHVVARRGGIDRALDLVGDVRDHLHGATEVVAAPLLADHFLVHLAGAHRVAPGQAGIDEALVVAQVEVGLGAVVGDVDLAVLERAHGARIHVDVRVQLHHRDPQPARLEDGRQRGRGDSLAERRHHAAGDEDQGREGACRFHGFSGSLESRILRDNGGMSSRYDAADIEVLSGLDPVRRRPGMYTDTSRPNHLAQEVVDNAVDEALAGHARLIEVVLHGDGSCEVSDDGRGMPVDIHPEEKVPGVELILGRLHAGGKFNNRNYTFSGGLHGVGVSVVNALSRKLEVWIKRDGNEYHMAFADGERASALEVVGSVGKRNTGTRLRFWPDPKYFDSPKFNLLALRHLLRAKAVLCPGLTVRLHDEASGERDEWRYDDGLRAYLSSELQKGGLAKAELLPPELFTGSLQKETEIVDWALAWVPDGDLVQESY